LDFHIYCHRIFKYLHSISITISPFIAILYSTYLGKMFKLISKKLVQSHTVVLSTRDELTHFVVTKPLVDENEPKCRIAPYCYIILSVHHYTLSKIPVILLKKCDNLHEYNIVV
jgi:hypothetical protein